MSSDEGSVVVMGMLIMTVLLILVFGMVIIINNEIHMSFYEENSNRAFYIAEAGIEYASKVLNDTAKWDLSVEPNSLYSTNIVFTKIEGLTSVTKETSGSETIVTSKGTSNGISKIITATYNYRYIGSDGAFEHSLVSQGDMTLLDNSTITGNEIGGDIYSNADIILEGSITTYNCEVKENQSEVIFPQINLEAIRNHPEANTDINQIGDNITYINGDLTLASNDPLYINGEGLMLVDGNLYVHDKLYFNNNNDEFFILIVNGETNINDIFYGNGLLYSYGNASIHDINNFKGTIISEGTLSFDDVIDITFDNSYLDIFGKYGITVDDAEGKSLFTYELIRWQEE